MKVTNFLQKNNHSIIAITLVLAIWFLTFIPVQVSLPQIRLPQQPATPPKPVIRLPKNYVSFVRERKVDVRLSIEPRQTDVTWCFLKNGNTKVTQLDDNESFFSAEIMGDTAIFRHKRQKYGETTVTIAATKTGQQDIIAKREIPVFIYDVKIPNDYVSFYHNEKGIVRINLSLNPTQVGIKWYLLNPRGDRLNETEEEFFSATVVGDAIDFEGVRDKFGESILTVAATKMFLSMDPTQPQEERNIAEKQITVIVPSEKSYISRIAKTFGVLKSRRKYISLIIKGGDIMLPIIFLFVLGLGLSIERLWFLFLQWSPGDKNKDQKDKLGRTNLSWYANDIISKAQKISSKDPRLEANNPIARILKVGIKAKENHSNHNPPLSEERLEFIIKEEMEKEIERQEEGLSKWTNAIGVCNILAPLFGFFGTIVGLIAAFMNWTNSAVAGENIRVEDLAGGMYQAMITTAGGLIVTICLSTLLGIVFYRIRKFTRVMYDSEDEMLKVLVGTASGSTPPPVGGGATGQGGNPPQGANSGDAGGSGGNNAQRVNNPQDAIQNRNAARRTRIRNDRKIKTPGMFSMVDIVMNLFIFFFIAFNLIAAFKTDKESNVKDVSIPRTTDSPTTPAIIKPVRVTIQKDKTVLLDKSPITPAELTGAVRPALEKNNDMPGFEEQPNQEVPSVIIAADEEVDYDYVMKVLNAVKDSGLLKIGLTAIPKEG